jgi:hypothetical protein
MQRTIIDPLLLCLLFLLLFNLVDCLVSVVHWDLDCREIEVIRLCMR